MGIFSSIEEYTMHKFRLATETTFGLNPHSSKLITSVLNPFTVSGLKNWGALLLKNTVMPLLDSEVTEHARDVIRAPVAALRTKDATGFRNKVFTSISASVAKFGWEIVRDTINPKLQTSVSKQISNQIIADALEKDEGAINLFLNEIVLKPQEKNLLKLCVTEHISSVVHKITEIGMRGPMAVLRLAFACRTIFIAGEMIAPYLSFPFNTQYGILITALGLSVTKLAVTRFVRSHQNSSSHATSSASTNANTLITYACNNPVKLISQAASQAIYEKIKNYRYSTEANFNTASLVNKLYNKLSPMYEVIGSSFLYSALGQAVFLGADVSYRATLGSITEAITVISQDLNLLMSLTSLSTGITALNKLTQAMAEAKVLHEEAMNHLTVDYNTLFNISASKEKPFELVRDKKTLFTLEANLSVEPGDILLIAGGAGSGKSTFGAAIASGAFVTNGKIERTSSFYKSMQAYTSMPDFTMIQDILGKESYSKEEEEEVTTLLKALGMADKIDKLTSKSNVFSGGQQQKISLIAALISKKELIMLDEPFGPLDAESVQQAMTVIKDYAAKGRTFIIIDHPHQDDLTRRINSGGNLYNKVCAIKDKVCSVSAVTSSNEKVDEPIRPQR